MAKSRKIYKIKIADDAADFIRGQTKKIQRQIMNRINFLAESPETRGEPIRNSTNTFKMRTGWYRIAYQIQRNNLIILVVRIGHRKDFYQYYDK
jgi:mRNA interferase RelE/StbE